MRCSKCKQAIKSGQSFCTHCGTPIENSCPQCQKKYQSTDNFCSYCGYQIKKNDPLEQASTQKLHIIEKGIKEELKHVSILFADIKGSTALIENLDPEEAHNLLKPIIETMLGAVYKYNGIVIHTAGDGIVALFGAPIALEDHALRACYSALAMQAKVKSINENISIRVGINSGEIILDTLGTDDHREYDATGAAVNLAARLEQSSIPGRIQLSEFTYHLVKNHVEAASLTSIEVKGFNKPIARFELLAINQQNFTIQAVITTQFFGRTLEMAKLKKSLDAAKNGHGNIVTISGAAGQGKSRLVYELAQFAKKDFETVICGGLNYNKTPLLPIFDLFQKLLRIKITENKTSVYVAINKLIKQLKLKQDHAEHAIASLLNIPIEDKHWNQLNPELKLKYIFATGNAVILNVSQKKPLLLIIEDMHLVDTETEAFINSLISNMNHHAIMLLINYRPEYHDAWHELANYTHIKLGPINQAGSIKICDSIIGNNPSLHAIKQQLIKRAGGNPFFIEEILKNLIDQKTLIGQPGSYALNTTCLIATGGLPETIYAVILSQIDRLPLTEKVALKKISVLGQKFNYSLCVTFFKIDSENIRPLLDSLQKKQFIFESEKYPEVVFTFKHALIQEAIYNSLLKTERKLLHSHIVTALETTYPDQINHFIEILAHHAYEGEQWEKAFKYAYLSAKKAFIYSAHQESINLYEKALIAASHLPATKKLILSQIHIYLELYHSLFRLSMFENQNEYIEKAILLANKINSEKINIVVQSAKIGMLLDSGKTLIAKELTDKLYSAAKEFKNNECIVTVSSFLLQTYLMLGDYSYAISIAKSALKKIPDRNYVSKLIRVKNWYVITLFMLISQGEIGDFKAIEAHDKELSPLLTTKKIDVEHFCISFGLGLGFLNQKNLTKAKSYLQMALQLALDFKIINYIPVAASALGYIELLQNNKLGMDHINMALEHAAKIDYAHLTVHTLRWAIEGLLLLDDRKLIKQTLAQGFDIVEKRSLKGMQAHLLRLSAQFALQSGRPNMQKIKHQLEESLLISQELNMKPNSRLIAQLLKKYAFKI